VGSHPSIHKLKKPFLLIKFPTKRERSVPSLDLVFLCRIFAIIPVKFIPTPGYFVLVKPQIMGKNSVNFLEVTFGLTTPL